jgi:hypothetical protein
MTFGLKDIMERIIRDADEHLYQPAIHSDLIKELYRIKTETGIPLTKLVDMALRDFIDAMNFEKDMAAEYDPDRVDIKHDH